jgi:AraC-like DNA-binding protein
MEAQFNIHHDNTLWVGKSTALTKTRHSINAIAGSNLPVLICGLTGTGKGIAARELHEQSKGKHEPFVIVCCKRWNAKNLLKLMDESWGNAQGGTLFVRNIEALNAYDAAQIKDFWLRVDNVKDSVKDDVRLIASTNDIRALKSDSIDIDNHFINWLQYHCLTIELPTLVERAEDLEELIQYYQSVDSAIAQLSISQCASQVLKNYNWPDNVKQLKRCLDKLVVLAADSYIDKHMLFEYFPAMHQAEKRASQQHLFAISSAHDEDNDLNNSYLAHKNILRLNPLRQPTKPDYDKLLRGNNGIPLTIDNKEVLTGHHPALDRAIPYLYDNYKKALSMDDLASHACVSPSHLSFLFKRYVGQSFKQTLLSLRIHEAMKLLINNPKRQVTHVCDDVGFSDLSFFVRKFKATVGMSPGVYRDRHIGLNGIGLNSNHYKV